MKLPLHPTTRRALTHLRQHPAHAYLFVGPAGLGKLATAQNLALELTGASSLDDAHILIVEAADSGRRRIKLEQVQAIITQLQLKSFVADRRRVVVLAGADTMSDEAANALLKMLEEPPAQTVFLITAQTLAGVLPTIRSRTQIIRFMQPEPAAVAAMLQALPDKQREQLLTVAGRQPATLQRLVDDPEQLSQQLQIAELADEYFAGNLTTRFAVAKRVHDTKLAQSFLTTLFEKTDQLTLKSRLLSAETQLNANLNTRLVFENLALELVS